MAIMHIKCNECDDGPCYFDGMHEVRKQCDAVRKIVVPNKPTLCLPPPPKNVDVPMYSVQLNYKDEPTQMLISDLWTYELWAFGCGVVLGGLAGWVLHAVIL